MSEPKKSLGQHWLNDEFSLNAMVEAAEVGPEDIVLEIGPGLGSLTKKLAEKAEAVFAVELDKKLAEQLPNRVSANNLRVINENILKFDLTQLPTGYKVAANIPYYLTNNLLRVLCESANPPSIMSLLVQKEVAQRVAAKPGQMSLLSVSVQYYCDVVLGTTVPASLFTPPPKVDSQILKLTYLKQPLFNDVDSTKFFRVVKAGFANRRKTLLNSLSAGLHLTKDDTAKFLDQAKVNPSVRAQELSLDDWHKLYLLLP